MQGDKPSLLLPATMSGEHKTSHLPVGYMKKFDNFMFLKVLSSALNLFTHLLCVHLKRHRAGKVVIRHANYQHAMEKDLWQECKLKQY